MRYALITAIGLAIIGLMVASYASITPEPNAVPAQYDDGYVESIPK